MSPAPRLFIRAVGARDRERLADLVERMGPATRYQRFHAPNPHVDPAELVHLAETDGRAHVTLAAVDPRDGSFAGIAQYAPTGDGRSDVAFAVADDWQRRGVGTMLALALLRSAAANRRHRLIAMTLGENRAARALLRRLGGQATMAA